MKHLPIYCFKMIQKVILAKSPGDLLLYAIKTIPLQTKATLQNSRNVCIVLLDYEVGCVVERIKQLKCKFFRFKKQKLISLSYNLWG